MSLVLDHFAEALIYRLIRRPPNKKGYNHGDCILLSWTLCWNTISDRQDLLIRFRHIK